MSSVRFVTYGCKANQYDTQLLRETLRRRGWTEQREADLVVVNTCTVTAEAGRKARQLIRRIGRETPETRICVTGCLAESEPEILRELPGVEWVLGNGEAKRPAHFLRQLGEEVDPEELGIPSGITEFAGHTRAFLKIQDGCNKSCAFCIIPKVRGKSLSRPADELETEVRGLLANGFREIVLCGIHIGHWGLDLGQNLAFLIEKLAKIESIGPDGSIREWRLRLSSIEATEVVGPTPGTGDVLGVMADHPKRIAPHLHMPLQSGDDEILVAMNRWYTRAEYLKACDIIRAKLDRPAFTADVLVGFDGETERHFLNTLRAVHEVGFARLHVFPFSPRPDTAAANPRNLPQPSEVRDRRARLSEAAADVAISYRNSLVGARETVVLEGFGGLSGRYQRVKIRPEDIDGIPPAILDVELELVVGEDGESTLYGQPLQALARQ
ncbi:MAG: threonylcarbamoyladenosine tRNA methylthiotransferase MtaB [Planctomycetota bacterium]|jgi:threonylcarbamoyladenosine tRNA methylthiotransferase MtaB